MKKKLDLYWYLFLYYRVMRKVRNMKNIILSLISLLMFVGCGNNITNPNDEHHINWSLVDPEADKIYLVREFQY